MTTMLLVDNWGTNSGRMWSLLYKIVDRSFDSFRANTRTLYAVETEDFVCVCHFAHVGLLHQSQRNVVSYHLS
jgi:hypothetical protein